MKQNDEYRSLVQESRHPTSYNTHTYHSFANLVSSTHSEETDTDDASAVIHIRSNPDDSGSQVITANEAILDDIAKDKKLHEEHLLLKQKKSKKLYRRCIKWLKIHEELHLQIKPTNWFNKFRISLGKFLESKGFQLFILLLIIADVALLTTELVLEKESHEHKTTAEEILKWMSWSVLITFAIEIVLLLIAFGWRFFTNPLYVFDFVIIGASIILEIVFHEEVSGYLILARLWRLLRIIHGIVTSIEEHHHEENRLHHRAVERVHQLENQLLITNTMYKNLLLDKIKKEEEEPDDEEKALSTRKDESEEPLNRES